MLSGIMSGSLRDRKWPEVPETESKNIEANLASTK